MKKIFLISFASVVMSLQLASDSWTAQVGTIKNTKHNLSTGGPHAAGQTIYAQSEQEICVFCHIPHSAPSIGRPLWNHNMPSSGYTMYSSDYLTRAAYPMPSGLGTTNGSPGMLSRQCLSCHDGTVAVGSVYAVRGTTLGAGLIGMAGVTGSGMIPTGGANFGADLSHHHPVGIQYNSTINIAFGAGSRTMELSTTPNTDPSQNLPMVYNEGGSRYVECTSCHDPHTQTKKFMRVGSGANLAADIAATCTGCHSKTGWSGSVHQSNASAYSDASVQTAFGANTIASLACMNCHMPHNAPTGSSYVTRQVEEKTCFQGASGLASETACHGSSSSATTNRIQTVITRGYGHPTTAITGVHTNLDVLYPTTAGKGLNFADSKHAECLDCHNPHRATNTPMRVASASWYPTTVLNTSNQTSNSGPLTGVSGVQPTTWPANFTVPTTFTTQESSTYEYQICFKCHSYYALRNASGVTGYTTLSGAVVTDQSMEFNTNNLSAHPVVVTLNNLTGSYAPKALAASAMATPWDINVGNQTMYCSDCHGTDNETAGDPKGPHGSSYKYMLKGPGKYWPANASGVLYTYNTADANLFCSNCHTLNTNAHTNNNAMKNANCVACHVAIPHGWKRSRLIAYAGEASPYNYGGNSAILNGFKKAAGTYPKGNCYSTNAACSSGHGTNAGGYDL